MTERPDSPIPISTSNLVRLQLKSEELDVSEFNERLAGAADEDPHVTETALTVLGILAIRRMPIDSDTATRLMACTDYEQVNTWLARSLSCATLDEIFA